MLLFPGELAMLAPSCARRLWLGLPRLCISSSVSNGLTAPADCAGAAQHHVDKLAQCMDMDMHVELAPGLTQSLEQIYARTMSFYARPAVAAAA